MNCRKANNLSLLMILGVVLLLPVMNANTENEFLCYGCGIIAIILIIMSFVIKFIYYRCPHCKEMLPFRAPVPNYCPKCGKKID